MGSFAEAVPTDGRSSLESCLTKDDCLFMELVEAINGGLLPENTASTELSRFRGALELLLDAAATLPLSIWKLCNPIHG